MRPLEIMTMLGIFTRSPLLVAVSFPAFSEGFHL